MRGRLAELAPVLASPDQVVPAAWGRFGAAGELERTAFRPGIADFYLTNPISRASAVMHECSELFVHGSDQGATGTHG